MTNDFGPHEHNGYDREIRLRDGTTALIRPVRTEDGERIRQMYERLSGRSVYFRYHRQARLSDADIKRYTDVDYDRRFALVAEHGPDNRIIGVVFYARLDGTPARAEVAITVEDEHQGLGLGPRLLAMITRVAADHCIEVFEADVLGENEQMLRVLRKGTQPLASSLSYGVMHVSLPVLPDAKKARACGTRVAA